MVASPAARWSGWLGPAMRSQRRSGELVRIRSGRNCRIARVMSRRSSSDRRPPAVGVAVQELDLVDAERGGRGPLLGLPQRRHLLARSVVEAAGVATGNQQIRHLDAGVDPAGDVAGRAEVDVIGVGEDAEHALDVGQRLGGAAESSRELRCAHGRLTVATSLPRPARRISMASWVPSAPSASRKRLRISCSRASTSRVPPAATRVTPTSWEIAARSCQRSMIVWSISSIRLRRRGDVLVGGRVAALGVRRGWRRWRSFGLLGWSGLGPARRSRSKKCPGLGSPGRFAGLDQARPTAAGLPVP